MWLHRFRRAGRERPDCNQPAIWQKWVYVFSKPPKPLCIVFLWQLVSRWGTMVKVKKHLNKGIGFLILGKRLFSYKWDEKIVTTLISVQWEWRFNQQPVSLAKYKDWKRGNSRPGSPGGIVVVANLWSNPRQYSDSNRLFPKTEYFFKVLEPS